MECENDANNEWNHINMKISIFIAWTQQLLVDAQVTSERTKLFIEYYHIMY